MISPEYLNSPSQYGDPPKGEEPDLEAVRSQYKTYMKHPAYKRRLTREMFGDKVVTPDIIKQVDAEYDARMHNLETVQYYPLTEDKRDDSAYTPKAFEKYYPGTYHSIETSKSAATHETSHAVELGHATEAELKDIPNHETKKMEPNTIGKENLKGYIEKQKGAGADYHSVMGDYEKALSEFKEGGKNYDEVNSAAKEFAKKNGYDPNKVTHSIHYLTRLPKSQRKEFFKENPKLRKKLEPAMKLYEDQGISGIRYHTQPTEQKARINALRLRAIEEFGYDQEKPFDINDYPELKKDQQYKELIKASNLNDDKINELAKYIAAETSKSDKNIA